MCTGYANIMVNDSIHKQLENNYKVLGTFLDAKKNHLTQYAWRHYIKTELVHAGICDFASKPIFTLIYPIERKVSELKMISAGSLDR